MMDHALWQDYLRQLEGLTKTIGQLTEIEKKKTLAVSEGRLDEVEACMRQEQALSLSLRGFDQKREAMLARMGLTGVPLRQLEDHAPDELLMETKRTAEKLRGQYEMFQTASQVARNTLECNLRVLEQLQAEAGQAPPAAAGEQGEPGHYDFRV